MSILSGRFSVEDTIVALASAPGGAARGIVRISGPAARDCAATVFRPIEALAIPEPTRPWVVSGAVSLPGWNSSLPCDAYLWPADRGYTRQQAVELHTLGSPPLLESLVGQICQAGARPAEPGEFTLRAFLAGRLDLTQAEAVLGVIDAADRRHLDSALAQLAGGLGRPLARLRETLLDLLAHLEAGLDFVDEDIEFIAPAQLRRQLTAAVDQVQQAGDQLASRGETRPTTRVVLIGRPNVGKSSLFNALAGRRQALVSPTAGTTRDYLAVDLDLDGIACRLIDTAGAQVDGPHDSIATAANELRDAQALTADIRLFCLDATRAPDDWERAELAAASDPHAGDTHRIVVWTKRDQLGPLPVDVAGAIETSAHAGTGLAALGARLRAQCAEMAGADRGGVAGTAERCGESLRQAGESLQRALELSASPGVEELVAAELRLALDGLGQVVGQVYTDDILDRVFSRFCIGK